METFINCSIVFIIQVSLLAYHMNKKTKREPIILIKTLECDVYLNGELI